MRGVRQAHSRNALSRLLSSLKGSKTKFYHERGKQLGVVGIQLYVVHRKQLQEGARQRFSEVAVEVQEAVQG